MGLGMIVNRQASLAIVIIALLAALVVWSMS
jgi:hypothetical protein